MSAGQGLTVIRLTGELDVVRKDEIRSALVVRGYESGILIDLTEATYADSTALAELLRFRSEANEHAIPMALVLGNDRLRRLLRYAGLADAFALFDDRASALTHLSREAKR